MLVAASLAAVCLMSVVGVFSSAAREQTIARTIDLLRAEDGVEAEDSSDSIADRLLAWQDEPYLSAISTLVADAASGRE